MLITATLTHTDQWSRLCQPPTNLLVAPLIYL